MLSVREQNDGICAVLRVVLDDRVRAVGVRTQIGSGSDRGVDRNLVETYPDSSSFPDDRRLNDRPDAYTD